MELIERITLHLREGHWLESKDPIDRRIVEMISILDAKQIVLSPDSGPLGTQGA